MQEKVPYSPDNLVEDVYYIPITLKMTTPRGSEYILLPGALMSATKEKP